MVVWWGHAVVAVAVWHTVEAVTTLGHAVVTVAVRHTTAVTVGHTNRAK